MCAYVCVYVSVCNVLVYINTTLRKMFVGQERIWLSHICCWTKASAALKKYADDLNENVYWMDMTVYNENERKTKLKQEEIEGCS